LSPQTSQPLLHRLSSSLAFDHKQGPKAIGSGRSSQVSVSECLACSPSVVNAENTESAIISVCYEPCLAS
jgi:hypothetical protein